VGTKKAAVATESTKGRKEDFEEILTGYKHENSMKMGKLQE
jgi:hypothetical protein